MSYSKIDSLNNNIEAIRTALILRNENRTASAADLEILNRYTGFGGLKCVTNISEVDKWPKSDQPLYPLVQKLHGVLEEYSNSREEASALLSSIKNSTLTGIYTPEAVAKVIGGTIERATQGRIGKMLEPSCGGGAFLHFSEKIQERTAYEKDLVTGMILAAKEPATKVRIEGFENFPSDEKGQYDLSISNIPFADVRVFDPELSRSDVSARKQATNTLHTYYFVKNLDAVKEGGIIAFITTRGVADSQSHKEIRRYLMQNSDLISAVRLTDDVFMGTGGIEVGSDLIILQKNTRKDSMKYNERLFIGSNPDNPIAPNNYFNNPIDIHYLGKPYPSTNQFGKDVIKFKRTEYNYTRDLSGILERDFQENFNLHLYMSNYGSSEKQAGSDERSDLTDEKNVTGGELKSPKKVLPTHILCMSVRLSLPATDKYSLASSKFHLKKRLIIN